MSGEDKLKERRENERIKRTNKQTKENTSYL